MTKICHVTSVHDTNDVRIFKKECVSLAKKKEYEVYLVGPGCDNKEESGVKIIGAGERPLRRIDRMFRYAPKVISKAIEVDADIYHLHDPELLRHALKLKRIGKKVIFDSHENILDSIDEKNYLPFFIRKLIKIYFRVVQAVVVKRIDAVIIVTPQMRATYLKYNKNIYLISNFPILSSKEIAEKNYHYNKGEFLFAGGISDQWSHKEIIEAISGLGGIKYYLYGAGDEQYLKELHDIAGSEKVHFGGKIPFEEVQQKMQEMQFIVAILKPGKNTFYSEGTLGNTKLFEAMGNYKPVIATNFSLWKEIIEDNKCGICVDPNDVESIKKAIQYMLDCPDEEIVEMGQNGRKAVEGKYNWGEEEKNLYLLYNNILFS